MFLLFTFVSLKLLVRSFTCGLKGQKRSSSWCPHVCVAGVLQAPPADHINIIPLYRPSSCHRDVLLLCQPGQLHGVYMHLFLKYVSFPYFQKHLVKLPKQLGLLSFQNSCHGNRCSKPGASNFILNYIFLNFPQASYLYALSRRKGGKGYPSPPPPPKQNSIFLPPLQKIPRCTQTFHHNIMRFHITLDV